MERLNLEIASEFLVMASTLIYLKSKSLLPKQEDDEKEITQEELIRRIVEYKKYKEIISKLRENYNNVGDRLFRTQEQIKLPKQKLEKEYEKDIIPIMYEDVIERASQKINQNAKNIEKIAITESYTVGSKVKEMFKVLIKHEKFVFNNLF